METKLKALKNEFNIYGRVNDIQLEVKDSKNGDPFISGNVDVLVEEKVNGELRSHVIRTRVFSMKYKKDGKLNGLYTGYETVMNDYKSIANSESKADADLVRVQGSIGYYESINQNGELKGYTQYEAKFFNRQTKEEIIKAKGPKATAVVEVVVDGFKDILDSDQLPSGDKEVQAFNIDFFGDLRENSTPYIPIKAIVKEELVDAFEGLYDKGDTGKLTLKINAFFADADETEVEETISGFGSTDELADRPKGIPNFYLEVIGGTEPYTNGREYDDEQIAEAKEWEKKMHQETENGYVPEERSGFGNSTTETATVVEPTPEIDDADLPDF